MFWNREKILAIDSDELAAKLETPTAPAIVDVRSSAEFDKAHLPGAVNIPLAELETRKASLDPSKPTVFYCARGIKSAQAAKLMKNAGFDQAYNLTGGINGWKGRLEKG